MNKVPRWVFHYVGNKTFDFSVGGLVGRCGALAVSRKTPIYFIITKFYVIFLSWALAFAKLTALCKQYKVPS